MDQGNSFFVQFDWNEVEVVSKNADGICGAMKCFWRSTTDPDNVGYLVADDVLYTEMTLAYNFAKNVLEGKCRAKHLYLEKPFRTKASPKLISWLNSRSVKQNSVNKHSISEAP